MRERRLAGAAADRANAWLFALHPALYRSLDHRAAVRLWPPDFELVKQHRARPL